MLQSVCILGRQPALGLAELESLYGAAAVAAVASGVAGLTLTSSAIDFARLGGSTRLAVVLNEMASTDWKLIEKELHKLVRSTAFDVPASGKFHLGLSAYGLGLSTGKMNAAALTLKKIIRARGVSVRVVPNNEAELNTAQVFHSHLVDENGAELLLIRTDNNHTLIACTVAVQDIDSYALRDRGRPKRDARVGMLPPKLAQIIINLAANYATKRDGPLWDPFCGTGVLLQEALLQGIRVYGTDLEPRMIEYTEQNLEWLKQQTEKLGMFEGQVSWEYHLRTADATTIQLSADERQTIYSVACETYLGRPFTDRPSRDVLEQTVSDVNNILKKFLTNIHGQLAPGSRLCVAMPAWFYGTSVRHLPVLDTLVNLGYERVRFAHADTEDLIYHREGQIVGRELVTLVRK